MEKKKLYSKLNIIIPIVITGLFLLLTFLLLSSNNYESKGEWYNIISYLMVYAIVVWGAFIVYRIRIKRTRQVILSIFVFCFFWLIFKQLRRLLIDPNILRYVWYLYYLPLSFVPALIFLLFIEVFYPKFKYRRLLYNSFIVIGLLFFIGIITNDFHEFAFKFSLGTHRPDVYTRAWLYYVITYYDILLVVFSFIIFAFKTRNRNHVFQLIPIFSIYALLIPYIYLYNRKTKWIFDYYPLNDMTFLFTTFIFLLLELYMRNGLIQNNGLYMKNFTNSYLPLCITNDKYDVIFKNKLFNYNNFSLKNDLMKTYYERKFIDGKIIVEYDLTEITNLRSILSNSLLAIEESNKTLEKVKTIKEREKTSKEKAQLQQLLRENVETKWNEITQMVDALPEGDYENIYRVSRQLQTIKFDISYLKQKCMLILLSKEKDTLTYLEYEAIINVLRRDMDDDSGSYAIGLIGENIITTDFVYTANSFIYYMIKTYAQNGIDLIITIDTGKQQVTAVFESEKHVEFDKSIIQSFKYQVNMVVEENFYRVILAEVH